MLVDDNRHDAGRSVDTAIVRSIIVIIVAATEEGAGREDLRWLGIGSRSRRQNLRSKSRKATIVGRRRYHII